MRDAHGEPSMIGPEGDLLRHGWPADRSQDASAKPRYGAEGRSRSQPIDLEILSHSVARLRSRGAPPTSLLEPGWRARVSMAATFEPSEYQGVNTVWNDRAGLLTIG